MSKAIMVVAIIASLPMALHGQGVLEPHPYMRYGVVEHHAGAATVKSNFGRPLEQAMTAVREEYGWVVDYEDPPYQGTHDVMDTTNPKYRAAHPNTPVVLGPAGGAFQSTYPETPQMWTSPAAELEVLERIVSDYNQSGNPGDFVVRELSDGSFDVVGTSVHNDTGADVPVAPVLDTSVSVPSVPRSVGQTLDAILAALPVKAIANGPANLMMGGPITVGGGGVAARDLLGRVIAMWPGRWAWSLLYDPESRTYVFNIEIATRVVYGAFGQRRLVPIGPAPGPPPGGP